MASHRTIASKSLHHIAGSPLLLSPGDDGAVWMWDVREELVKDCKLHCEQEFRFHCSCVLAIRSDVSQTCFASTGLDGVVALWLRNVPIPLLTLSIGEPCTDLNISPLDPSLLHVSHGDCVTVWDVREEPHYIHFQRALSTRIHDCLGHVRTRCERAMLERLQRAFPDVSELIWSTKAPSQRRHFSRTVLREPEFHTPRQEFDEISQRYVTLFKAHHHESHVLFVTPVHEGRTLLSSATDHTHKLWNAMTRKGVASLEIPGQRSQLSNLTARGVVCHSSRFVYGADAIGGVCVWDLNVVSSLRTDVGEVLHPVHTLQGHRHLVTSISLSQDDTVLVTGDATGKLHVRAAV